MDKLGKCPNCDYDWDGGEIIDHIRTIDAFIHKRDADLQAIAAEYGWTPTNQKHHTNVIMHTINGELILECPSCRQAFEDSSGLEFDGMEEAKELMP